MDTQMNVTDGQVAVMVFDKWQDLLTQGEIADCRRFHDDFFASYGKEVQGDTAPYYLMFCAFVGAMDMVDMVEKEGRGERIKNI